MSQNNVSSQGLFPFQVHPDYRHRHRGRRVSLPERQIRPRPVSLRFGSFLSDHDVESDAGTLPADDTVLDYLATGRRDDEVLQTQVDGASPSYPLTSPELERTVTVWYKADGSCPVANNLPIRTLTDFIEAAVQSTISTLGTPDVNPYPVEVTVTIKSPSNSADGTVIFTADCPLGEHAQQTLRDWLKDEDALKHLIDYQMAYSDLKQCTTPSEFETADPIPIEYRSARFDPTSRILLLTRMLRSYFQVALSGTSWFDGPPPPDGVLECVWFFMKKVVHEGNREALRDLHRFLSPSV